jgi:hypothetical protein
MQSSRRPTDAAFRFSEIRLTRRANHRHNDIIAAAGLAYQCTGHLGDDLMAGVVPR